MAGALRRCYLGEVQARRRDDRRFLWQESRLYPCVRQPEIRITMYRSTSQCLIAMFSLVAAMFLLPLTSAGASVHGGDAARGQAHPVLAVTAAHTHHARWYTVDRGDTLAGIARQHFGHASWWPGLWAVNRRWVHNPNVLAVGQTLRLSTRPLTGHETHMLHRLMNPPAPRPVRAAAVSAPSEAVPAPPAPTPAPEPAPRAVSYTGGSSFQQCVIRAESGGNPGAVNPYSGAGGLYGFLPSTWHALGFSGLPQYAPVSVQNAAFAKEYAASGTSAWAPYDSC